MINTIAPKACFAPKVNDEEDTMFKKSILCLLTAGFAAVALTLAVPAKADEDGDGHDARQRAHQVVRHERREARHERREHRRERHVIRHERREHRRDRREDHRERQFIRHHRNGGGHLIDYTVGAGVGYAIGYETSSHYVQQSYYDTRCTPVSKIGYDGYGRAIRIGGTMCFDGYGAGYVVPGSRYVIGYY